MDKNESVLPKNHVLLPTRPRMWDRDYTIREIKCEMCGTLLAGLVIPDEHEGTFVWPFKVLCGSKGTHSLIPRTLGENANVICYGRSAREYEVKKFLEPYALPEQKTMIEEIEIMGRSLAEIRRILAWYDSMTVGERMRANLKGTLDLECPYLLPEQSEEVRTGMKIHEAGPKCSVAGPHSIMTWEACK
jgi:hypothetical protein